VRKSRDKESVIRRKRERVHLLEKGKVASLFGLHLLPDHAQAQTFRQCCRPALGLDLGRALARDEASLLQVDGLGTCTRGHQCERPDRLSSIDE